MELSLKVRALKSWIEQNGPDAVIPVGHKHPGSTDPEVLVRLDRFVSTLRKDFRDGKVDPEVKAELDTVGFQWQVSRGPRSTVDLRARNQGILQDHRDGMSLSQIGDKYGISRQRTHQIVKAAK